MPVCHLEKYDKKPKEYRQKILDGKIKINDEDLPVMLYPQPNGFDKDDIEGSLLRNQTIVRFWRHIFTSPKSATRPPGMKPGSRTGQAFINGMKEVTPGSIIYATIMFWYTISAIDNWRNDDNLMDRAVLATMLYDFWVECMTDSKSTLFWREDMLEWWNFQVFGIIPEKADPESDSPAKKAAAEATAEAEATAAGATTTTAAATPTAKAETPPVNAQPGTSVSMMGAQTLSESRATTAASHSPSGTQTRRHNSTPPFDGNSSDSDLPITVTACSSPPCSSVSSQLPPIITLPCTSSPAHGLLPSPSRQPFGPSRALNVPSNAPSNVPSSSLLKQKMEKDSEKKKGSSNHR
ncbi:hypothetical protein CPB84DRAFT_1842437 [Gymnopilus junonius]|uniref:Uncharacterized protein n=1 Tax=Gymnopilus junonius TaxID=109634 RepID=A0A9P5NZ52_GYMJU|nr:hypothetical protein CPB84DRAFT_1842437 [Gymnopilus junonius]